MDARRDTGRLGEDAAEAFYEERGYAVVERNYRCSSGEIDLICRRGRTLVFCEVKCRRSARWGVPAHAVDGRKRSRIRRVATGWLLERGSPRCDIRFDVVSVIVGPHGTEVTHIPGAF